MDIMHRLSDLGYRRTKTREAVLSVFEHMQEPVSAVELQKILQKQGVHINRTTVYRELWFLQAKNILQEVFFGEGKSRFELTPKDCHHHLVCNTCGKIEDIHFDESKLLKKISLGSEFKIEKHSIEFFGKCASCQ